MGRVYVADRANNRIQIFESDGKFVAEWKQFGRPSDVAIDKNDMIYVADSQSTPSNNPGFKQGIRIGSVKDGKVTAFIPEPSVEAGAPEGIGVDDAGLCWLDRQDGRAALHEVGVRRGAVGWVGHQPQDRQGARSDCAVDAAGARRRGDRIEKPLCCDCSQRLWHKADMPVVSLDVRFRGGKADIAISARELRAPLWAVVKRANTSAMAERLLKYGFAKQVDSLRPEEDTFVWRP